MEEVAAEESVDPTQQELRDHTGPTLLPGVTECRINE